MEYHVLLTETIRERLGGLLGGNRNLTVRFLSCLYDDLKHRADIYRKQRDRDDADLFLYAVTLLEDTTWHTYYCQVNDVQAQGYLFVVSIAHHSRPA